MKDLISLLVPTGAAFVFALILIPVFRVLAVKVGLVDKPNARKIHQEPVPLIGGISIAITMALALMLSPDFLSTLYANLPWIAAGLIMLVIGALDDRFDIKPVYRLFIQMSCAYVVAASDIRITSFYGLLGIGTLPVYVQYGLTIIVITGVINAYNLMDGIDGLLGSLTIVAASVFAIIAFRQQQPDLVALYLATVGAIAGFLRFNLSAKKIFMGDAGSLFLGFILVVTAIRLLNLSANADAQERIQVLLLVAGIFLVPVLDSLRVYRARIKKGVSPFKADKTHLHHLFLFLGITHKRATLLIIFLVALIIGIVATLTYLLPATWVIVTTVFIFACVTTLLSLNRSVHEWREKVKKLERSL